MAEINVALLGYKFMGKAHSNAYRQLRHFFPGKLEPRMKVICGRDRAALEAAKEQFGWEETETDWRKVVQWLTGDIPEGKSTFYQKHMTHHLLPEIDRDWMRKLDHVFLIREPREVITSLALVTPNPGLDYKHWGCTLGGPIVRNRTFFFAAFERLTDRFPEPNQFTVPTAAERQGDFSALLPLGIKIYDPMSAVKQPDGSIARTAFGNNLIPQTRLNQVADGPPSAADEAEESHLLYRRAVELIQVEFEESTWKAFYRMVIDGVGAQDVAAELGITPNAAYLAKARVLRRLREEFCELEEL